MESVLRPLALGVPLLAIAGCASEPAPARAIVPMAPVAEVQPKEPELPPEPQGFTPAPPPLTDVCELAGGRHTKVGLTSPVGVTTVVSIAGPGMRLRLGSAGLQASFETADVRLVGKTRDTPPLFLKRPRVVAKYFVPGSVGQLWTMKGDTLTLRVRGFYEIEEPVACDDVALESSRFDPLASAPAARGNEKRIAPKGAPLAPAPKSVEVVMAREGTLVEVAEVRGGETLVRGWLDGGVFFGWVPSRALVPNPPPARPTTRSWGADACPPGQNCIAIFGVLGQLSENAVIGGLGVAAKPPGKEATKGSLTRVRCTAEVRLLAELESERFGLGAAKPGATLLVRPSDGAVTELGPDGFEGMTVTKGARLLVPTRDLVGCEREEAR